ncbi:MAG: tetratricopeptide repeat protein, partial [Lachnospiraceae bacterium]|nr:tetratricopeptide repeat protein [Lachnospiraceae bacterium]
LCELGTESWNGGNKTAAASYYQLSLSINPDDPETMFLLARLYQSLDKNKEANEIFDKIIAQHPQSNYARRSREARGY